MIGHPDFLFKLLDHMVFAFLACVILLDTDHVWRYAIHQYHRFFQDGKFGALLLKSPEKMHIIGKQADMCRVWGNNHVIRYTAVKSEMLIQCAPSYQYG